MDINKENKLGTMPIGKLLFNLAVPAVAAQFINMLYNIVDRIYIGNIEVIGKTALTGVGVTFPILLIVSAFSAFAGMGGAPLASIKMGEGDKAGAEKILGNSFCMLLCLSAILTTVFLVFKEPLLYAFGASENLIGYANDYITIYLYGTVFVQISLGLNTFISAQGQAKTAMMSVMIGAVANIILDPIFIFGFDMGVKGAAIATVISQLISAIWVLKFLFSSKSAMYIKKENIRLEKKIISSISKLGVAPFIMQSTESLVSITLNRGLQVYGGDLYVGSMTILMSVLQLIVMPINGVSQGAQPIMSYNYGAGNIDRVKKTFKLLIITTVTMATLGCLATMTIPQVFVRLFNKDAELVALTSKMMPIFMGGIWAFGAQMGGQGLFLSLGQAKISLFLALLRKVMLLVPLALILPLRFGVMGIYYAEPIADLLSATTTIIILAFNFKRIMQKKELGNS